MSSFLDLPNEILYLVVENLPRSEVQALNITCKTLHARIEPLLYASFDWTWEPNPGLPQTNEWPQKHCSLVLLLRSILEKPQLATYIRSVTLCGSKYCEHYLIDYALPTIPSAMYANELSQFVSLIRKTGVPYANSWVEDLQQGRVAAFVALLLTQTHNLTRLHLGPNFTRGREMNYHALHRDSPAVPSKSSLLGKLFHTALLGSSHHGLPKFNQLEHISMPWTTTYRDPDDLDLANTLIFFYLPALKSLSARCPNAAPIKFPWPSACPSSPIESLDLAFLREKTLCEVLKATKNLKSLRWEWQYDPDLYNPLNNRPVIELEKLAPALKPVRNTLQSLTISAVNCMSVGFYEHDELDVTGTLEKLASLNLKHLQIPLAFILGRSDDDDDYFFFDNTDDNDENLAFDHSDDDDQGFSLDHSDGNDEGRLETGIPHTVEELILTHDLGYQEGFTMYSRRILHLFHLWFEREDFTEQWPDLRSIRLKVDFREEEWVEHQVKVLESLTSSVEVRSEVEEANPCRVNLPQQSPIVDLATQDANEGSYGVGFEDEFMIQPGEESYRELPPVSRALRQSSGVGEEWPEERNNP
ncbi:hypothetical protein FSARC_8893 [Fusarium sarcochroum]|uniref:F-box domain-containing protein n=1 Tax=Fusarium sarcochroum TaxID=1208366 RepID=A0A8H4X5V2_9HYPO|nr:hypothetical protein FSARC_8893 [Fusarium sarcochroum]